MKSGKRSDVMSQGASPMMNLLRKGVLHGAGLSTDRLRTRPLIAIANSHTELSAGHSHLDLLAERVRDGVLAAGGECTEFNVPGPCDGVAMAHDGMRFVLAQRDLIADLIETHMRSQPYDGMVFISGCDKVNPAMMMAAARLDLPAIYLSGGPGVSDVQHDHHPAGERADEAERLARSATCATCGACEVMGTANTFHCLAEVFGMCLPGTANIPSWHGDKLDAARRTGERIVAMVAEGLNARQMFTPAAFRNAVRATMAVGGSTNAALHLPAIAQAAEVPLCMAEFEAAHSVPTLLAMGPHGPHGINDLWLAGGMPALMKQMQSLLDTRCMTVTGQPLAATIEAARVANDKVIPPMDRAHRADGAIAILRGNLAPDTAVVKRAHVAEGLLRSHGLAVCFDTEEDAMKAVAAGRVRQGDVVVLRYQGPRGGPGMPELLGITLAMQSAGLGKSALVSDGRFSGGTAGPCVGHVCPEASEGGPIALVEDGDMIEIDILSHRITLHVEAKTLAERAARWKPREPVVPHGYLRRYRRLVRPACEGAVLD